MARLRKQNAVVIEGKKSIRHRIRLRERVYLKYSRPAAKEAAEFILAKSNELVPVDTERLRKSGHVRVEGKRYDVSAYARYDAPYAVYVHEDLTKYHEPPTRAKFLEIAAVQYHDDTRDIIRNYLDRNLPKK